MSQSVLTADILFGGRPASDVELSTQFDRFLGLLANVREKSLSREEMARFKADRVISLDPAPSNTYDVFTAALSDSGVAKSLSREALASITATLETARATNPDLTKDFSLTSPIPSGAVAFDLETPMKDLAPRPTPIRNRTPRMKGVGSSHRFKSLTGFTGSGSGGVGVIHPGIVDTTQNNFAVAGSTNALYYHRGPKISYAGMDTNLPYMQFSVSDEVTWSAQYAGQGYQDIRAVSRTHLLYSSMLLEERIMLYGRGTAAPYSGVLAAPVIGTATARAVAAGETAITGFTTNIYVRIAAESGDFGVSQTSAAVTAAVAAGQVVDVTYTLPAGGTGARAFVSTGGADPGDASRFLAVGRSGYNTVTIQGPLPVAGQSVAAYGTTSGAVVNLAAGDGGSAYSAGYDGIWAYCTSPTAGYNTALNAAFSTTNPGTEYQAAFAAMHDAVRADPDRIVMNGRDRKQLSDTVKGSANSNYSLQVLQGDVGQITLGTIVPTVLNEVTGKRVEIEVHPWMPQGNSAIISDTLPLPDSNVSNVWAAFNVQDYLGMDWPVNQFAFEASSYWFGTFVCYAPPWNGALRGIKLA